MEAKKGWEIKKEWEAKKGWEAEKRWDSGTKTEDKKYRRPEMHGK